MTSRITPLSRSILVARPSLSSSSVSVPHRSRQLLQQSRRYASQKPQSATGDFYKTFTRPVAKCALLAILTYQFVYWGWLKLEQDEIKADRQSDIAQLEAQVEALQRAAAAKEKEQTPVEPKPVKKGWWPF
ncbi:hypothetical protein QBC47DRAFT_456511 [Echria macrotheca]|uniref:Inner membrane assembly complex subunit 17 n=1 Tax=Echria macrotheca TaxID=438768 RepID=A0AAJ0BPL5_9PEZI|nr:hypothetical protein QBC47DRAFT_456511 [Echria macrotheca]